MLAGELPIRRLHREGNALGSRRQAGLTLIETLITLLSTSVGLLAVAALHLVTTANYQDSTQRLHATNLAVAMLEQIRAHPAEFERGLYYLRAEEAADASSQIGQDVRDWRNAVAAALSANGTFKTESAIHGDPTKHRVTITIAWQRMHRQSESDGHWRQVVLQSTL